uniref:Peptide tyrosine phenylalanine 1 n=1 Tax=Penaeus monodon TaxID=6687 RepID=PYF1_PENMO|nr:RecName: Full=Peptide tyrosine phenylalanine 1; AltName: Full=Pem-PYF1 [Penaeus monodon]
RARPRF